MRHFYQWLCGYIRVCLRGRQVNRFLNLCTKNGIRLWRITNEVERELKANIRLHDFYNLKPYLRKTKTRLCIISKKGFPFWCHRHPKLKWFLCLCFLLICVGCYSMNFIWDIKIKGNHEVSSQQIISCLQNNSIDIGLNKNKIDCSNIELLLRQQFQQIGWVSVYFDRTNLCVEVKESLYDVTEFAEVHNNEMYHLIAEKDAVISSIITRAGKSIVKEGQFVKKGEVLVLGQSEIFEDNGDLREVLHIKADALVFGDVVYEIKIPCTEIEIMSLKIAGLYSDEMLLHFGNYKLNRIIEQMNEKGLCVLESNLKIEKKENNICFLAKILAREQIGINIPVEEVVENEFE